MSSPSLARRGAGGAVWGGSCSSDEVPPPRPRCAARNGSAGLKVKLGVRPDGILTPRFPPGPTANPHD
jgi:hypothetical protein